MTKSGPVTEEGKEVVRWNATRHGIRSPAPVVPGIEKAEDWERHLAGTLESLSPEGHLETVLAERVALSSWRLYRVARYQTESIALYQEQAEDDLADRRRFGSHILGADHPEAVRGNLKAAQVKHRLLKRLPKLEADKHLSGSDADTILWDVTEYADDVAEGKVAPENLLEGISVPGVPEDVAWEDLRRLDRRDGTGGHRGRRQGHGRRPGRVARICHRRGPEKRCRRRASSGARRARPRKDEPGVRLARR
jgi:hypothetical protein